MTPLRFALAALALVLAAESAIAQEFTRRRLALDPAADGARTLTVVAEAVQAAAAQPQQEVSISARIQFAFDSDALTLQAQGQLAAIAAAMNGAEAGGARFLIEGHTDAKGREGYNLDLSRRRAQAALTYLLAQGVAFDRLQALGYGEARLLPGVGPHDAAQRRVEFLILR